MVNYSLEYENLWLIPFKGEVRASFYLSAVDCINRKSLVLHVDGCTQKHLKSFNNTFFQMLTHSATSDYIEHALFESTDMEMYFWLPENTMIFSERRWHTHVYRIPYGQGRFHEKLQDFKQIGKVIFFLFLIVIW